MNKIVLTRKGINRLSAIVIALARQNRKAMLGIALFIFSPFILFIIYVNVLLIHFMFSI